MDSDPRRSAPRRFGPSDPRRLPLRSIREMPVGYDEEVGAIFRDMRAATNLTRQQLARRLATGERTVEALEQGALLALPEWPETSRVVLAYTAMLGLDAKPVLRRIHAQIVPQEPLRDVTVVQPEPLETVRPAPAAFRQASDARSDPPSDRPRRRSRRRWPWAVLAALLMAAVGGVVYAAREPRTVLAVLEKMPQPIPRLARAGLELVDPDDPRRRKADKLPMAQPGPSR